MIRVHLPFHLRTLAGVADDIDLDVAAPVTIRAILDALEARFPVLRGSIRDHGAGNRRPFLRFYACEQDLTITPLDDPLPEAIASGKETFLIIGGLAGG